jgi:hypothetical protein
MAMCIIVARRALLLHNDVVIYRLLIPDVNISSLHQLVPRCAQHASIHDSEEQGYI